MLIPKQVGYKKKCMIFNIMDNIFTFNNSDEGPAQRGGHLASVMCQVAILGLFTLGERL